MFQIDFNVYLINRICAYFSDLFLHGWFLATILKSRITIELILIDKKALELFQKNFDLFNLNLTLC